MMQRDVTTIEKSDIKNIEFTFISLGISSKK